MCCSEEIVAHSSNVSSLVLGKSSGRLLATGGEDCRVNIWAISKPNCIMVKPYYLFIGDN